MILSYLDIGHWGERDGLQNDIYDKKIKPLDVYQRINGEKISPIPLKTFLNCLFCREEGKFRETQERDWFGPLITDGFIIRQHLEGVFRNTKPDLFTKLHYKKDYSFLVLSEY